MGVATVTLRYDGKEYALSHDFGASYEADAAHYMWTDGNYGCDCNKCVFIQQQCDATFPDMDCGNQVELVQFDYSEDK